MSARPLLHIVDGSGYIFRAYYAIRGLSTSSGEPTNAVFGFAQMLLKAVADERPQHLALTFDTGRPSFRQAIYPAYKANRPPPPEDLPPQIPRIHEVAATFRMRTFVIDGFEADDVIATLSRRAIEAGYDVRIITGDKDLMQLVTDRVTLFDPMKEKRYGRDDVIERFGVPPEQVVDVLALAGDATDNVPGVRGVGEKTAAKLIATHGSLAGVVAAAKSGAIKGKTGEVIAASEDVIEISRRLVVLDEQVPLDITMEALAYPGPDYRAQLALFEQLELKRLLPRVAEQEGAGAAPTPKAGPLSVVRVSPEHYEVVVDRGRVEAVAAELAQAERVGLSVELSTEHVADAEVYGLSVCGRAGYSYYLPVGHNYLGVPRQLPLAEVLGILRPVLEDAGKPKVGLGIKSVWSVCAREGVALRGLAGDGELASYLLDPDDGPHEAREVSHKFVGHALVDRDELLGRGKKRRSFGELTVEEALPVAAERADVAFRAYTPWSEALSEAGLTAMSTDLELPLVPVLGRLELSGVRVDVPRLSEMGGVFEAELSRLEKVCYEAAGQELNLGSPKQLQKVLFEDLGLRIVKRTKTGPSTDASALEAIVDDHPLPQAILDYRQIQKLQSTYVETLPLLADDRDGARAHLVQPGRGRHGAAVEFGPEPAEHPDPHRPRPPDPARVRAARRRQRLPVRRLLAGRTAPVGAPGRRPGAAGRVPRRRRRAQAHGRAHQRHRRGPGHFRDAQWRQGDQLRGHLRHGRTGASRDRRASRSRRRPPSSTLLRHLSGRAQPSSRPRANRRAGDGWVQTMLGRRRLLPDITSADNRTRADPGAGGREHAHPGHGRGPDQAGDAADPGGARRRRQRRAPAPAGAR
jgi:DNA polymerase-1